MKINKSIIKELNDYLDEFNLTEIEYTEKDVKVKVSKSRVTKNIEAISPAIERKIIKEEKSRLLNEMNLIKIRNKVLISALPQRV